MLALVSKLKKRLGGPVSKPVPLSSVNVAKPVPLSSVNSYGNKNKE